MRYLLANGADHQRWGTHLCGCAVPQEIFTNVNNEAAILTSHWSPLHLAICKGHSSTAKILIDWGVSCEPTLQLSWNCGRRAHQLQPSPMNVMHEIAIYGNLDILNSLIFSKNCLETMINSVAFQGNTPLHCLAISWPSGSEGLFNRLLSLDPDLNVPNNDLLRPIDCFVDKGNLSAALRLFQLGSRPYQLSRCILSACNKALPKSDLRSGYKHQWIQQRNDLVLSLIYHALDIGQLTRDVGGNRRVSHVWNGIFQFACLQPTLLRELLRAGFRPDLLTGENSILLKVLQILTRKCMPDHLERSLLESTRMLVRAGERWDRKGPQDKTPLDHLVKDSDSVAPELRAVLFKSLLGSRPPEQTGAEQAHLNQLAQYALANGKMEIYRRLVRHGAKDSAGYRVPEQNNGSSAAKHQGLVALQWFKPDLKLVTANRLGRVVEIPV